MLVTIIKWICVLWLLGGTIGSTLCFAESAIYTIEKDPYAPVKRLRGDQSDDKSQGTKKAYIRDPDLNSKAPTSIKTTTDSKRKSRLIYKEVRHQFKPAKIKGTLRAPRVVFMQDQLELTKIADPMPTDFLDEPIDSSSAMNY